MSDPLHTTDLESMLRPDPRRHASRILAWALCWPWNLVWTFCVHNPFRYIVEFLVAEIGGAFDEISRGQFREIERDLIVDAEETARPSVKRKHEPRRFLFFKRRPTEHDPEDGYLHDFSDADTVGVRHVAAPEPVTQQVVDSAPATGKHGQPAATPPRVTESGGPEQISSESGDAATGEAPQTASARHPAGYPATVRYIHQSASETGEALQPPAPPPQDELAARSWDTNPAPDTTTARSASDAKSYRVWTPPPVSFRPDPEEPRSGSSTDSTVETDAPDHTAATPNDMWTYRPTASGRQANGQ